MSQVRELFAPAEAEYAAAGDSSALHVIVFDEMDAVGSRVDCSLLGWW